MSKKVPVASFRKGQQLTHAQCMEFQRLKGPDGKGKFKFAPEPDEAENQTDANENEGDGDGEGEDDVKCSAETKSGKPCGNNALPDSEYCGVHDEE